MKKLRLVLVATVAMLFLGMMNVNAQEKNTTKTVIIRITEGSGAKNGLVTIDANGKVSKIAMEKGHDADISANNGVLIQKEIEKWKQEGYQIKHLSSSGETVSRTTIILEK
ncbi:MAG TPA: hypothetical protein PLP27_12480 [Crocinitomicaceae bacterium]|nr:hypothetical protein [Crocinitomicaceae bacterium]